MYKFYFDPGHGGSDPGAIGNGLEEKNVTLNIVLKMRDYMKLYENVEVRLSRDTDKTVSLKQRTDDANNWKADHLTSVHINAYNGEANGYEDFIYSGYNANKAMKIEEAKVQNYVHEELMNVNGLSDRGKKEANFHMLREVHSIPALLTENGFIDNVSDARKLKSEDYLWKIAKAHVKGLAKAYNLKKKEVVQKEDVFYRVITGSFTEMANAERRVHEIKKKGFESFIDVYTK